MSPMSLDSSPQTSESTRRFDGFLHALCDPEGGSELYQMHAPSAAVRSGDGIRPAADVDLAVFASAQQSGGIRCVNSQGCAMEIGNIRRSQGYFKLA